MSATTIPTRFRASITLPGAGYFPLEGRIDSDFSMRTLANNGTWSQEADADPARVAKVQPEADRIRTALLAGHTVATKTATISPVAEDGCRLI